MLNPVSSSVAPHYSRQGKMVNPMNLLTSHIPPQAQTAIDEQAEYHQQVHQFFAKDAEETDAEDAAHSVHVYVPPKRHKKRHKK